MAFVAMDIGASGNRFVSASGQICTLPNNMSISDDMTLSRVNPDSPEIESCLEFQIVKTAGSECKHFPANVLVGIMARRACTSTIRPSGNVHKYEQRINFVSVIMNCAVSKLKHSLPDHLDVHIDVPPVEVATAQEEFGKQLPGTYEVTLPKYMGGTKVIFTIDNVAVYPESYMAALSFFFNMNGQPRKEAEKYLTGDVLSIDIGASTSDFYIVHKGSPIDSSGKTYPVGGNIVRDELIDLVYEKYSQDLSVEEAEIAVSEGRLRQGNNFVDISDLVVKAKEVLANKIIDSMQTYFRRNNVDIRSFCAIMVSGGGSKQSQYVNPDNEVIKTSEPISYYVTKGLAEMATGTDIVPYGDDARLANVKGTFIKAMLIEALKSRQAAAAAQAAQVVAQPQQTVAQPQQTVPVQPTVTEATA